MNPIWMFDARDEKRVRDFCIDLFGTDGEPCKLVTMRVVAASAVWDTCGTDSQRFLIGRSVARVFSKTDNRARLGDGVVVTGGRFFPSGSHKNPSCNYTEGTVFELRDVPEKIAIEAKARNPELIEILDSPISPIDEDHQVSEEVKSLMSERASIAARLAEIDKLLLLAVPSKRETPVYEIANDLRDDD